MRFRATPFLAGPRPRSVPFRFQSWVSVMTHEIHAITDTEEHARDFLHQRGILMSSMLCPSFSTNMVWPRSPLTYLSGVVPRAGSSKTFELTASYLGRSFPFISLSCLCSALASSLYRILQNTSSSACRRITSAIGRSFCTRKWPTG